ncbi:MAG: hypothetical protein Q4D61_08195 [Cardiobacteriaceae bacterium]|nr:hypothetical protein [Cardiobacteriaceae bacterium]
MRQSVHAKPLAFRDTVAFFGKFFRKFNKNNDFLPSLSAYREKFLHDKRLVMRKFTIYRVSVFAGCGVFSQINKKQNGDVGWW